jgi:3-oxoadipate enol-lactonase
MREVAANTRKYGIDYTAQKAIANNFPSAEKRAVSPENQIKMVKIIAESNPEGYARTCEMIVDPSHIDPDYAKITCPAVFVAGDMDNISPLQRSETLNKLLGGPSWVEVVKSGHQPLLDDTEATANAILKLLKKV